MSMMNHKVDPLNEERSVIDNLIASSQDLMGPASSPLSKQSHTQSDYQNNALKSKVMLKSRRGRTSFTPGQLSDLETAFANTHYPDFQTRKDLSNRLKIPDDRIQVWFQNRRAKWRKTQRQINGGPPLMNFCHGNQTTGSSSSNVPQAHERSASEIPLNYNLSRPSPIKHTGSFTHNSVSQGNVTDMKTEQHPYQGQQNLANLMNIYEKSKAPCTTTEMPGRIPDNQRTAPSLYSLSAAVTSSGQYIVLGPSTNPPTTYPMTMSCSNYSVHNLSQNSKY